MIRKYHNHKLQTTPWHREEEPLNHYETPGRLPCLLMIHYKLGLVKILYVSSFKSLK